MDLINFVHEQLTEKKDFPTFRPGDRHDVTYKIMEGGKAIRSQTFRGDVLQINGTGATKTFTVRKVSNGVGVERVFPFNSPILEEIKLLKQGKVRRAKLYYLRDLVGKKARIKEKAHFKAK